MMGVISEELLLCEHRTKILSFMLLAWMQWWVIAIIDSDYRSWSSWPNLLHATNSEGKVGT